MHAHSPHNPKGSAHRYQQLRDLHSPSRGGSHDADSQPTPPGQWLRKADELPPEEPLRPVESVSGESDSHPAKRQPKEDFSWEGVRCEKVRDYYKKS